LQGTPAGPTEISDLPDGMRQVVLVKDGQRFVFRYEQGEESKVLASLMQMAKDPDNQLDWFDAAVLSHQMGRRMSKRLEQLLKP
jgi:hypothetical protein